MSMSQFKATFRRENYVTDTVGHTNTQIQYDDFNRKYREWEIRRGFRDNIDTQPTLRGIAKLKSVNKKTTKKSK